MVNSLNDLPPDPATMAAIIQSAYDDQDYLELIKRLFRTLNSEDRARIFLTLQQEDRRRNAQTKRRTQRQRGESIGAA